MENKKQVEEMANFICHSEFIDISYYEAEQIAVELLKHYQPKIPEDSIVLDKKEYEKLKLKIETLRETITWYDNDIKKIRKETVKEILEDWKNWAVAGN